MAEASPLKHAGAAGTCAQASRIQAQSLPWEGAFEVVVPALRPAHTLVAPFCSAGRSGWWAGHAVGVRTARHGLPAPGRSLRPSEGTRGVAASGSGQGSPSAASVTRRPKVLNGTFQEQSTCEFSAVCFSQGCDEISRWPRT